MATLKKLKFKSRYPIESFPKDITSMVNSLKIFGYEVSRDDVRLAWEEYSNELCASWVEPPKDRKLLVETLLDYLEKV